MKRLINNGDIFDKYANLEEDTERQLGRFTWYGHMNLNGTYKGSAYTTTFGDRYMATELQSPANPKGSILQEAKNYTDSKLATAGKTLYAHYIRLGDGGSQIFLNYISSKAEKYTIQTFKADLTTSLKKIICSGYYHSKAAQYICVDGEVFTIGVLNESGTIDRNNTPTFSTIQDYVEAI